MDKKEILRKQEDAALVHGLFWVLGAAIIEVLLLLVDRYYINYTSTLESVTLANVAMNCLFGARIVGVVVYIAALVLGVVRLKNGKPVGYLVEGGLGFFGALLVCAHLTLTFGSEGVQMLLIFVPALGGLALSFFLYQRDFFFSAAVTGMGALVLWMIWHRGTGNTLTVLLGVVKLVCVVAILAYVVKLAQKRKGALLIRGRKIQLFPEDAAYGMVYLSCGISLAFCALAFVMAGGLAYYMLYALGAWIFALLVYYTVRML